jgi:hypothetical protein
MRYYNLLLNLTYLAASLDLRRIGVMSTDLSSGNRRHSSSATLKTSVADPDPNPVFLGLMDPDPDPKSDLSIIKQKL